MKVYDLVEELLIKIPELRNSDKRLLWVVWFKLGLVHYRDPIAKTDTAITRDAFYRAPSSESITRARRRVQELHPELASNIQVQSKKDAKEATKGTFVYREEL